MSPPAKTLLLFLETLLTDTIVGFVHTAQTNFFFWGGAGDGLSPPPHPTSIRERGSGLPRPEERLYPYSTFPPHHQWWENVITSVYTCIPFGGCGGVEMERWEPARCGSVHAERADSLWLMDNCLGSGPLR